MPLHGDDGDTGIRVRLIGSDPERRLGRFETATCPDRIPSVVLPLPAPMRRPLGHRDGSSASIQNVRCFFNDV